MAQLRLAFRPDRGGRAGRTFRVVANFFSMHVGVRNVYHYNVEIKQPERRRQGSQRNAVCVGR